MIDDPRAGTADRLAPNALHQVRSVAALTTPFTAEEGIDHEALGHHIDWLTRGGLDGVMVAGTTGEGALLEEDELAELTQRAREAAAGRATIIANVGRPGTAATARLADRALAAGADAIAACVPYYYPLSQRQVMAHYEALLRSLAGVPLLAYVIPSHTGNDLTAESFAALLALGLAGLKDSTMDLARHEQYIAAAAGREVALLTGSDSLLARARAAGGTGSITALANVAPEPISRLHRAFDAGDATATAAAQNEVDAALRDLGEGNLAVLCKQALARLLDPAGVEYPQRTRPPL